MARAKSSIVVIPSEFRSIKGLLAVQRRIAALPDGVADQLEKPLDASADELVAKIRAITPVSDLTATPGALRDSVHKEAGDHQLSRRVVEDAVDAKGRQVAKHVNYGHKAADGTHVPAKPHFWPAYQVLKKRFRSRMGRAFKAAVKTVWARGGQG